MKEFVKVQFRKMKDRSPNPPSYCLRYPAAPTELLLEHPALYAAVFGSDKPPPMQLDMNAIRGLESKYTCRNKERAAKCRRLI